MRLAPRNLVSLAGVAVATAMAVLFLMLAGLEFFGYLTNPYIGLLVFVAVPTLFVVGLLLIPAGAWWAKRRRVPGGQAAEWPVIDLRGARQRTILFVVFTLTVVNLAIVSLAAYGGVHYMESSEFCGQVCHTTMEPQYVAHQNSPHARVECVQCHIGPGAGAFVEAKLAGARQLAHVITGTIPRPVPSPLELIRPARDTCEQCHWPEKVSGDLVREIREYSDDEKNTETVTTLQMHVGGGSTAAGGARGIHWHADPDNQIEFVTTDPKGETVPYIRVTGREGGVREYFAEGVTFGQVPAGTRRRMDCMDCHNRPAHVIQPSPGRAIDIVMGQGRIPRELPFVRREAVKAVGQTWADAATARAGIDQRLRAFYLELGADERLVTRAVTATQGVWAQNVFPAMKVTWGTYPNQIGHVDAPGCFRCHDDSHKTREGRAISQDCELCHVMPGN
ncbi:MAG: NapC/NirT family cytochrome c [Vicinamibacterales bacterium]